MPTGLTRDAGWEIGVSKTLPRPPAEVWDFIASPAGVALGWVRVRGSRRRRAPRTRPQRAYVTGTAFALAYDPLTIAATDGVAEREQGLAGGLLATATQFGSAVGISAVTAVYGLAAAGGDGSAQSTLEAFRAALTVPVAMVVLGALITSFGLRTRRERPTESGSGGALGAEGALRLRGAHEGSLERQP